MLAQASSLTEIKVPPEAGREGRAAVHDSFLSGFTVAADIAAALALGAALIAWRMVETKPKQAIGK